MYQRVKNLRQIFWSHNSSKTVIFYSTNSKQLYNSSFRYKCENVDSNTSVRLSPKRSEGDNHTSVESTLSHLYRKLLL